MLYAVYRLPSFYTISYTLILYTLYIYTLILKMSEWRGLNMATHSGTTLANGLTDRICPRLGSSSVMIICCITSLFNQQSPLYHINHGQLDT